MAERLEHRADRETMISSSRAKPRRCEKARRKRLFPSLSCLLLLACYTSHEGEGERRPTAGAGGEAGTISQGGHGGVIADPAGGNGGTAPQAGAGDGAEGGSASPGGTGGDATDLLPPDEELWDCGPVMARVEEVDPISCSWSIPPLPGDEAFDQDKVNFNYTGPDGEQGIIPRVDSAGGCGELSAWYYSDEKDPHAVAFCPVACRRIIEGQYGDVEVVLGCGGGAFL
jgi:hypothetical protein